MIMKYLKKPYDMIQIQTLSHMLLVWALSFVKLLWPKLRFLSCTHDQGTRTPTNKNTDSYTKSYAQHALFRPPNNFSIYLIMMSLSQKFHMPRKKDRGYAKK
jgi:hypothetical protein